MSKKHIKIKPGPALWRQGVGDIPVEVIKALGSYHGETYYEIKGAAEGYEGQTGVPASELIQPVSPEGENNITNSIEETYSDLCVVCHSSNVDFDNPEKLCSKCWHDWWYCSECNEFFDCDKHSQFRRRRR